MELGALGSWCAIRNRIRVSNSRPLEFFLTRSVFSVLGVVKNFLYELMCNVDSAFSCLLLDFFRPDLVDMERVQIQSNRENLEQAFEVAERLGVTRLLDAEGESLEILSIFGMF